MSNNEKICSKIKLSTYLSLQLFDPVLGPCKGVRVGDVVNHDCSLRTTVIHGRQRMVSFLPSKTDVDLQNTALKLASVMNNDREV